jgi:hypothetical protein
MDLPAVFGGHYKSYSNPPTLVTDSKGVEFRGILAYDTQQANALCYVVVRMDTQAVIFASPPGAGSGSISASPLGPLKVVWNVTQGAGPIIRSQDIPGQFTPFTPGAPGHTILAGSAAPVATQGSVGDLYLQLVGDTTVRLWGPKIAGGWGLGVSLRGPAGADGSGAGLTTGDQEALTRLRAFLGIA